MEERTINMIDNVKDYNIPIITREILSKGGLEKQEAIYIFEKFHMLKTAGVDDEVNLYRTLLISCYYGTIRFVLAKYYPDLVDEDFVQIGLIGLIKGIDKFDISKDVSPLTFLVKCIFNEIGMYLRVQNKKIKPISLESFVNNEDNLTLQDVLKDKEYFREEVLDNEKLKTMLKLLKHFSLRQQKIFILESNLLNTNFKQEDTALFCGCSQACVSKTAKKVARALQLLLKDELTLCYEERILVKTLRQNCFSNILNDKEWIILVKSFKKNKQIKFTKTVDNNKEL